MVDKERYMHKVKVLFLYYEPLEGGLGTYHEGIASISAMLKKYGYEVRLLHIIGDIEVSNVVNQYFESYADFEVVACTLTELSLDFYHQFLTLVKEKKDIYAVCGGPVATLCPETVMEYGCYDALCRGDGELPMLELCNKLSGSERPADIGGLWFYCNGEIIQNNNFQALFEISEYPVGDREIFDLEKLYSYKNGDLPVMASRGCPYNCSFCSNHALKKCFPDKKKYLRYKSIDCLIDEIKDQIEYSRNQGIEIKTIRFYDDLLIFNKEWFFEFAAQFKEKIGMPYCCNCRFELLNDEILQCLKDSGCIAINLGLETGSEQLRREVLNRNQPNDMILEKTRLCRKYGIKFYVYTMIGIPHETLSHSLETVKFSAQIQADGDQVTVFYPFMGTSLYDYCQENGFITQQQVNSYLSGRSVLKLPDMSSNQVNRVYCNFHPFYNVYKRLYHLPVWISFIPEKILDSLWYNYYLSWPVRTLYSGLKKARSLKNA